MPAYRNLVGWSSNPVPVSWKNISSSRPVSWTNSPFNPAPRLGRSPLSAPVLRRTALSLSDPSTSLTPHILYGTAWKRDATAHLVSDALRAGFRAIDTACQPKHYDEKRVGEGWVAVGLPRNALFIQTKFTSVDGQDLSKPIPYNPAAPLPEQVGQSIGTSLSNLQTTYLDSLVLHSPLRTMRDTLTVWRAFEAAVDEKVVRQIGISNCYDLQTLQSLYESARIKPRVLQNRFYSASGFDVDLRQFCARHGITYQSFWTLSANRAAINSSEFLSIARALNLTPEQTMYAFMRSLGIVPLCGTTNIEHMKLDLQAIDASGNNGGGVIDPTTQRRIAKLVGVPL